MKIQVNIPTVGSRFTQASALYWQLQGLFDDVVLSVDDPQNPDPWKNHMLATTEFDGDMALVLEDDAVLPFGAEAFAEDVKLLAEASSIRMYSLYLGTGAPQHWQRPIDEALYREPDANFLAIDSLIHFVGVMFPADTAQRLYEWEPDPRNLYAQFSDRRLGAAWSAMGGQIPLYPYPSLIDHADGDVVTPEHGSMSMVRRARRVGRVDRSRLSYKDGVKIARVKSPIEPEYVFSEGGAWDGKPSTGD